MQYKPRNQETVEKKSMRRQELLEEVTVDVVEDLQKGHKFMLKPSSSNTVLLKMKLRKSSFPYLDMSL